MTWKKLATWINSLSPEQQETDVTVLVADEEEFFQGFRVGINKPSRKNTVKEMVETFTDDDHYDQLDDNHPYLVI